MVYFAGARGKKSGSYLGSRQAWCSKTTGENENSLLDNLKLLELRKGRVLFGQRKSFCLERHDVDGANRCRYSVLRYVWEHIIFHDFCS